MMWSLKGLAEWGCWGRVGEGLRMREPAGEEELIFNSHVSLSSPKGIFR
jgi:hypothetical protein